MIVLLIENRSSPQILDDVPVLQSFEEFTEVERLVPPECASGHKYSPQIFVDVPVPQSFGVLAEVADFVPLECASEKRCGPQILCDMPVHQILEQFFRGIFSTR